VDPEKVGSLKFKRFLFGGTTRSTASKTLRDRGLKREDQKEKLKKNRDAHGTAQEFGGTRMELIVCRGKKLTDEEK